MSIENQLLLKVEEVFRSCFYESYKTLLEGGAEEPFYRAPRVERDGRLYYRHNFLRSALHESAHWCHAGEKRLELDDWGYWYEPDGRNDEQQNEFYRVEVKPQAIEKGFCQALGIGFDVSVDNIDGPSGPVEDFKANVEAQFEIYCLEGFPKRAQVLIDRLTEIKEEKTLSP